jgi:hypothetical protein
MATKAPDLYFSREARRSADRGPCDRGARTTGAARSRGSGRTFAVAAAAAPIGAELAGGEGRNRRGLLQSRVPSDELVSSGKTGARAAGESSPRSGGAASSFATTGITCSTMPRMFISVSRRRRMQARTRSGPGRAAYAQAVEVGQHRRADADVRATVEKVFGRSTKARGPIEGNGHETDCRATASRLDRVRDPHGLRGRFGGVVRIEIRQVPDEELIGHAHAIGQSLNEVVVGVKAAGEDESYEDVHRG